MLGGETYIHKYLKYTAHQESPDVFHIWGAIATIAYAVGRNVWVDQSYFKVYPNHYIILVAGSGACKKGAALGVARRMINDALGDRADRLFIPGKVYPEALIRAMNKRVENPFLAQDQPQIEKVHRPIMLYSPELGSFLSKGMQQAGMPDLLTELYDCPDEHKHITKNSGVDEVKDVCLNLLGATTPKWVQNNMTPAIFGEGFVARTVLVYAERPKLKAPRPGEQLKKDGLEEEIKRLKAELVADLDGISRLSGEFTYGPGAGEYYDDWYCNRADESTYVTDSGFFEREPDHVLKLAMCFALSAGTAPVIHKPHLTGAATMLRQVRGTMPYALAGAQAELNQKNMYRVLETIRKAGGATGLTMQELGRSMINYIDPETVAKCVTGLRQNGLIEDVRTKDDEGTITVAYRLLHHKDEVTYGAELPDSINPFLEGIEESGADDQAR